MQQCLTRIETYECVRVLEKRVDDPATGVTGSTDDGDFEHGR
jgi:hypothetical protein